MDLFTVSAPCNLQKKSYISLISKTNCAEDLNPSPSGRGIFQLKDQLDDIYFRSCFNLSILVNEF